ncbi:rho GTPase-activating protein 1-like [Silene latifolia]|uniref:rho GTPase-activating protein 1-like n=1 Tax=Silene latifolia TaxID=37657 RepID=UPI003D787A0D
MTEVVLESSSGSSINMTSSSPTPTRNDGLYQQHSTIQNNMNIININNYSTLLSLSSQECLQSNNTQVEEEELVGGGGGERKRRRHQQGDQTNNTDYEYHQLNNFVALFVTAFRRSVFGCSSCEINTTNTSNNNKRGGELSLSLSISGGNGNGGNRSGVMEIGLPTNVRHVAHVTFDRFNGFLGLPVEFEPEVPRRPPSASATVFGVSTNSMQLSFDTRGNSVPTILLMMQHRLYALGGLQAEGIFRINPDNQQEESVRDQLNRGLLPEDVDCHCLAGLIKAWFRELPTGVLDCLSPEQVMQSQTEQECTELARLLPPTEFALLDWAINLMADVAQFENLNRMNARNVAMVFAPNMTHMADPLTALMHAVQVMNLLKTLIEKTLREREDSIIDSVLDSFSRESPGENGQHFSLQTILEEASEPDGEEERDCRFANPCALNQDDNSIESTVPGENQSFVRDCEDDESIRENESFSSESKNNKYIGGKSQGAKPCNTKCSRIGPTSNTKKAPQKGKERPNVQVAKSAEKAKGSSLVSSMNQRAERIEAWR